MLYIYTQKAKHDKDTQIHIAQQSYIHHVQMMITTTTIHTQSTNDDYNNNHTQCTNDDYNNNHTYIVHKQ